MKLCNCGVRRSCRARQLWFMGRSCQVWLLARCVVSRAANKQSLGAGLRGLAATRCRLPARAHRTCAGLPEELTRSPARSGPPVKCLASAGVPKKKPQGVSLHCRALGQLCFGLCTALSWCPSTNKGTGGEDDGEEMGSHKETAP